MNIERVGVHRSSTVPVYVTIPTQQFIKHCTQQATAIDDYLTIKRDLILHNINIPQ